MKARKKTNTATGKNTPTPWQPTACAVEGIIGVGSFSLAGSASAAADLANFGIPNAFMVVGFSVFRIRRGKKLDAHRTVQLPFKPVIPVVGVIASEFLMLQLSGQRGCALCYGWSSALFICSFHGLQHAP